MLHIRFLVILIHAMRLVRLISGNEMRTVLRVLTVLYNVKQNKAQFLPMTVQTVSEFIRIFPWRTPNLLYSLPKALSISFPLEGSSSPLPLLLVGDGESADRACKHSHYLPTLFHPGDHGVF